jgi:hypothetical protein
MKRRGRPVLGAIAGFFCFLGLTAVLLTLGVLSTGSILVVILPVAGLVLGIFIGLTAPLGGNSSAPAG